MLMKCVYPYDIAMHSLHSGDRTPGSELPASPSPSSPRQQRTLSRRGLPKKMSTCPETPGQVRKNAKMTHVRHFCVLHLQTVSRTVWTRTPVNAQRARQPRPGTASVILHCLDHPWHLSFTTTAQQPFPRTAPAGSHGQHSLHCGDPSL